MRKILPAILIMTILAAAAHSNPFLKKGADALRQSSNSVSAVNTDQTAFSGFYDRLFLIQKELNSVIADTADEISRGNKVKLFFLLLLSFIYGLLHAAGPGHGKAVISSYMISTPRKYREAVYAGFGTGVLHALSATVLISFLIFLFNESIMKNFDKSEIIIKKAAAYMIIALALYIFFKAFSEIIKRRKEEKTGGERESTGKTLIIPVILAGIIPCPGAAMILMFTYSLGIYSAGILSVGAMSLGMGTTISAVSLTAAGIRKSGNFISKNRITPAVLSFITRITGSILLLIIGIIYLQG